MSETQFKLKTAYCRDYDIQLRFRKIFFMVMKMCLYNL